MKNITILWNLKIAYKLKIKHFYYVHKICYTNNWSQNKNQATFYKDIVNDKVKF